jgi:dimethylhistidine N-methyltransferase
MGTQTTSLRDNLARFAEEVCWGLCREGQKELPSKYFYDAVGSALFEAISVLPDYGLTRADERLLRRHARDIVRRLPRPVMVSELGSGSGKKTRPLLEALCRTGQIAYYPIEISPAALSMIQRELSDIHCVSVVGMEREYLAGLLEVAARRQGAEHMLVLFLGSTIGNFDAGGADVRFLSQVRETLLPGDALLLGADLVKPREQLLRAYDDPAGVTAAFNRNLLARINRELGADFDLGTFEHEARFNEKTSNVEMHLRSLKRQTVRLGCAGCKVTFEEGETIWTESSHKYTLNELSRVAAEAGFREEAQWVDEEWPFTESLFTAA